MASLLHIDALGTPPAPDVRQLMVRVMMALLPGTAVLAWTLGPGVLINVALSILIACVLEAVTLRARGKPVAVTLGDGSIALAAWLLALTLPPWLPVWQLAIGVAAMVWLGKHVFGGLGHNPFNPAMTAYAVLIVSFPVSMTTWPSMDAATLPELTTVIDLKLFPAATLQALGETRWDALTGATPLDRIRTLEHSASLGLPADAGVAHDLPVDGAGQRFADTEAGLPSTSTLNGLILQGGLTWANLAFLAGGCWLLYRRVIRWHIPLAVLGTLALLHGAQFILGDRPQPEPWLSLLAGAAVLGAFFIATDPVSAATSNTGRLLYGAGIGVITFVIREFGGYPEGIAFAVLIMNSAVPAIDHLSATRR